MAERVLRIFVSSPSDVAPERERVKLVADRLNAELDGIARLDILRWEDAFYTAAHSFQQAIDAAIGNMSATDMVLCIVWKRAGLKLNPEIWQRADGSAYESGTVLEFETAVDVSRKHDGVPDVYLFRKSAPVSYDADRVAEQLEQYELLQMVWKRWTESPEGYNTAGYQSFADADDLEIKLEACLRQWLERRGVVAKGPVWDRLVKGSPFIGLASFDARHAPVFFGREPAIARATARLRRAPFLLLIGASGSGKSSLLHAGLVPRVTAPGVIGDVDLWRTALVTPNADPLTALGEALFGEGALAAELRAGDFSKPHLLAELFSSDSKAALAPIRSALARAAEARRQALRYDAPRPARLLIAVDQMERLFVEAKPARAEAFADLLRALVEAGLASVIAALRSDAYGRFQAVAPFLALLENNGATLDVLPPSPSELEDIVTRPVAACHPPLTYETDAQGRSLAERLVADAKGGDALPLLQMTLQRLFEAEAVRGDGVLRFADYPGMDVAVARTAEDAVAGLDRRALAAFPALLTAFVRDVSVGPDGALEALTIVAVARTQFERGDPARVALIDEFVARRLLTTEAADGAIRVRPVHEALLRVVPEAVRIIKENAALIRVRGTLEPMAAEWSRAPASSRADFLATSPALIAGAAQLAERFGEELAADLRAFIAESLATDARRRDAERSRQRRILAATAAGLVVALTLAGLAGWQWQVAKSQRLRAENSLAAATRTANTLVFEMAQEFRDRGVPIDVLRKILDRARALQTQLAASGETSLDLLNSEAAALCELALTLRTQGLLAEASETAELCRAIMDKLTAGNPGNEQWQRQLAAAYQMVGDVAWDLGRRQEALEQARKSLAIRERLAAADPDSARIQSDLALSYQRLGDLLAVAGQRAEALDYFQKSLAINEALAAANPDDADVHQGLASSYERVGNMLAAAGRREEALENFRKSLAVNEKLAAADPDNTRWQRNRGLGYVSIAEMLLAAGKREEAYEAYRQSLAIRDKLAASDPSNALWQSDLSAILSAVGDMLAGSGRNDEALSNYRKALAITEKLAAADPANPQWQRALSFHENKVGDLLAAGQQWEEALVAYRKSLAIREALAAADVGNAERQYDLSFSHGRVGQALAGAGRGEEALESYRKALAIMEKLAASDPSNVDWQRTLSVDYNQLGGLLVALKRPEEAIESYRKDLAIAIRLAALDPGNLEWQHDLWASHYKLGDIEADIKHPDDARGNYRAGIAVLEKLTAAIPGNTRWQVQLVVTLFKLAQLGDDTLARLRQALAILRMLDNEGRLPDAQKSWIATFEQAIAAMPK